MTIILSLGNPAGTVSEDNGAMLVLVTLEGQLSTDVAITFQTYDGSGLVEICNLMHKKHMFLLAATSGSDYVMVSKIIFFNNLSPSVHRIYIPIINDDDCVEENEYFSVNISSDMECVDIPLESLTITITDDESQF